MYGRALSKKLEETDRIYQKINLTKQEVKANYLKDSRPWVITYSGGKDSTATLQLVLETIAPVAKKEIHVVYADTRVEPPPVINHAVRLLEKVNFWAKERHLPVTVQILQPEVKESFFVLLLGRGYLPPTRWFRWCTERLKIRPVKRYVHTLLQKHKRCVILLGIRSHESSTRNGRLKNNNYSKWMPFEGLKGAEIYAPILEFSAEDVWSYLLNNNPPWGVDNHTLRSLYTSGDTTCSIFCGGIRFGCWVCTVVKYDRCTEGLSKLPEWEWLTMLLGYREMLVNVRNNPKNRIVKRVNGKQYLGPLTLETRKKLYKELKKLETKMGYSIISPEEEQLILSYWDSLNSV